MAERDEMEVKLLETTKRKSRLCIKSWRDDHVGNLKEDRFVIGSNVFGFIGYFFLSCG